MSQRKYALDILEETGLLGAKPVETPMDPNVKLCVDQGEIFPHPDRYRRLVGKLNYLTNTRPDISFAVSVVSQFMSAPRLPHWEACLRIVKYLRLILDEVCFIGLMVICVLKLLLMLIGQDHHLIDGPLLGTVLLLEAIWSHGKARNKQWSQGLAQKQSIGPWHTHLVRLCG